MAGVAGAAPTDFVLDAWSVLSHKTAIGDGVIAGPSHLAPTWVGTEHARRLTAYRLYQALIDNCSRHFVDSDDREDRDNHREYGDAALLRDAIRDAVLGDRPEIVVDGAANFDPEIEAAAGTASQSAEPQGAEARPVGTPPPPESDGPTPEELADNAEAKSAADREEWLRDWADDENLLERMQETETCAVGLGDGIYVLAWDEAERSVCVVSDFRGDAGFYFPVRSARFNQRRPTRVHLASEVEIDDAGNVTRLEEVDQRSSSKRYVHRITYELVDLLEGESRAYAWLPKNADGKIQPSTKTCLMTEGYWLVRSVKSSIDFTENADRYETRVDADGNEVEARDLDLSIDFIPVTHIRNTPGDDWGQSSLGRVAQLLGDLSFTDTDLARGAPLLGVPPMWTAGAGIAGGEEKTYGPGMWLKLPEGSQAGIIDTSNALSALEDRVERLRERMSINSRVPQSVLGRVTGGAESGVHLALTFGPLSSMVGQMRLVRRPAYSELFDMVQKLAMAGGELDGGVPHHAEMVFGSYLPVSKPEIVANVRDLLGVKAISRELGLRLLTDAGFPIDDAQRELQRIEEGDFEGAAALLDALGDEELVYEYLRRRPSLGKADVNANGGAPGGVLNPPLPGGLQPRLAGPEPAPTTGGGAQPAEPEQR